MQDIFRYRSKKFHGRRTYFDEGPLDLYCSAWGKQHIDEPRAGRDISSACSPTSSVLQLLHGLYTTNEPTFSLRTGYRTILVTSSGFVSDDRRLSAQSRRVATACQTPSPYAVVLDSYTMALYFAM